METIAQMAMERILQLDGRKGSINAGQGSLKGLLNPTNMPTYKILVLDTGNGLETRILVNEAVVEFIEGREEEVEFIQYVGLNDNELELIMAYDIAVITKESEVVFREG